MGDPPHVDVSVRLALRIGADLIAEPWSAETLQIAAQQAQHLNSLDGALDITMPEQQACRLDFWDQIDGLLLAWLMTIAGLDVNGEALIEFPDTKIEAEVWRQDDDLRVVFEDIDATLPWIATVDSLKDAAQRLLLAANKANITNEALESLSGWLNLNAGDAT